MTQIGATSTQRTVRKIVRAGPEGGCAMWVLTAADLRMRLRQFAIATIGPGLVFTIALVVAGVAGGFRAETKHTVERIGADGFVVPAGSGGPFSSVSVMPA